MAPPRFFVDRSPTAGSSFPLPAAVAHHARNVLRLRVGAAMTLFDGQGGEYAARLGAGDTALIESHHPLERESPVAITLIQAVIGGDRMDWLIEKATELGVARIEVTAAERSTVRLSGPRLDRRLGHWREIAAAACAQCGRNRLPTVRWHDGLESALAALADPRVVRLLLTPEGSDPLSDGLVAAPAALGLAIGPEGDWTEAERDAAVEMGWDTVRLGPRVLRTETAAIAALACVQTLIGDLAAKRTPA